jgi:hypothetical protein
MATNPPSIKRSAFDCPHCNAYARQTWFSALGNPLAASALPTLIDAEIVDQSLVKLMKALGAGWGEAGSMAILGQAMPATATLPNAHYSRCDHCEKVGIWFGEKLVYPANSMAAPPHADMPLTVKSDYIEAAAIVGASPRGAAALLRLAIQKLCLAAVGEENINNAAAGLVAKGLDADLIRALDVLRVVGNNAVHPGEMKLDDDRETALKLFGLANLCVDSLISQPKRIAELFDQLPQRARSAIEDRNGRARRSSALPPPAQPPKDA